MLNMQYSGETENYQVTFKRISDHVVQLLGEFPVKTLGFILTRIGDPRAFRGDHTGYATIYREIEGGAQFSDDGSVYVAPVQPPEPEPYVPTLEETKENKIVEMNAAQQAAIQQGINVTLSDGTVEHFTLTDHDQTSLMGLQAQVLAGEEHLPWHTSDTMEHCKYYSNADMGLITTAALQYVTYHVTYFRDLRIYIRSLTAKEDVELVSYGIYVPEAYQSEVLKDLYAAMGVEG